MTIQAIGPIVAPVLGSLLLTVTSWQGIFVALALVSAALLVAAFGLSETLPAAKRSTGGIPATLSAFRELLTDRRFLGYALADGLVLGGAFVYISGAPFILENLYAVPPQFLGFLFGINGLGIIVMSQVNARLVGRVSSQQLLTWGLAATAFGGILMLVSALSGIGLVGILLSIFVIAASLGLIFPNAAALALANVRAAGSASALLGMFQLLIGAVAGPLVGLGGSSSAVPMTAAVAAFGLAALGIFIVFCRPAPTPTPVRVEQPLPQEVTIGD
jgi:DHA1 family bicyclomycin/chloramphenicol resistance-like MFS transporter